MERPEREALYGGAAGGGKSDALLIEALRQVDIPHYKGIIFRKTFPQLAELIDRSLFLYSRIYPTARYNATSHIWRFSSGATIRFGSIHKKGSETQYQGQAFDFIAFDELTHFTESEYLYMFSRNRPTGAGTRVYIRSTTNPGGIGHGWVKKRFIDAAPPMETIKTAVDIQTPEGQTITQEIDRIFIPSTVFDNQALLNNDPLYLANLANLPEADRQALLYGSWDSFSGQVFREWVNDPAHYKDRQHTHVIDPFPISRHWQIYRALDWGYAKPYAVGWYAVSEDDVIYHIRELYGTKDGGDNGVHENPAIVSVRIKKIESEDDRLKGKDIIGIADPAIFGSQIGESVAELMGKYGVYFNKADNKRIAGKMQMHYRLAFDEDGYPKFQVFNTCKHFIRTIPSLVYDERDVEDVDTTQEDHIYDSARYMLMARPMTAPLTVRTVKDREDPLNLGLTREVTEWQSKTR
jgi:hypothetical protein